MINKKYPNPKNLNKEKIRLQADIAKYKNEIADIKSKHDELSALKQNIDIFLGKQEIMPEQEHRFIQQEQPQQNRSSLLTRLKENQKKIDEINHRHEQSQHRKGHINPEL